MTTDNEQTEGEYKEPLALPERPQDILFPHKGIDPEKPILIEEAKDE